MFPLIKVFFGWLPSPLAVLLFGVMAVFFFVVTVKILIIVLDFVFRFIDTFKPF